MTTTSTEAPTITDLTARIREVNKANGWWDDNRTEREDAALIHTEIAEATEAFRRWEFEDVTQEKCGCALVPDNEVPEGHLCKPQGVGSELADVVIRLLDTADRQGWEFRHAHRHLSFMKFAVPADVVTFVDGLDELHTAIALRHYRRVALPLVATLAETAGVDLQHEVERKVAYNATRGHKHGGKRL